jgi:hypothetical protein
MREANLYVACECGAIIRGNSDKQLKYNFDAHKKSKKHKALIKLKEKEISQTEKSPTLTARSFDHSITTK